MKISIITTTYNSETTIRDTIESVLEQKNIDIDFIIIDGNSTDRTMAIVQEYGDCIQQVVSESDQGIYDAMNKGVGMAKGEIIGILNSDDFYADDQILQKVTTAFRDHEVDSVYGDLLLSMN